MEQYYRHTDYRNILGRKDGTRSDKDRERLRQ